MKQLKKLVLLSLLVFGSSLGISVLKGNIYFAPHAFAETSELGRIFQPWDYDAGPSPAEKMGRALIDLNASIPYFPGVSWEVMGTQKFRPAYGPVAWRMRQEPNSVKILFIGQDATHIAEAAGRPATAGFGGRAQDLAKYFGVSSSAAFINTYAFTIKGQYGVFDAPIITTDRQGNRSVQYGSFVENPLWLMTQDPSSPIASWRNRLIDWIIENNKDSLQMIVLFGGAARDAAGSYVESKGAKVGSRYSAEDLRNIRVPEMTLKFAGGNFEQAVPLDRRGKDLYEQILGRLPNYKKPREGGDAPDVKEVQSKLRRELDIWVDKMAFSQGGMGGSGVIHPAQLGGFDIDRKMRINGVQTISLKGLKITNNLTINRDLLVVQFPHPTALSMMSREKAAEAVAADLEAFKPYVERGWKIEPDPGFENLFAKGLPYEYRRADMGPEYYDFGAPATRMVNKSTAVRLNPNTIIFGTRDKVSFDQAKLMEMVSAKPSQLPSPKDIWSTRPRNASARYIFDAGPSETWAKLMKSNLYGVLPESFFEQYKTNKDYGHYRGTFEKPRVVIFADPDGYDDLITARALTGTRGQYLQHLMSSLGFEDQYLVIKTAPFDRNNDNQFNDVVMATRQYREALWDAVVKELKPTLVLTDGYFASAELRRISALKRWKLKSPVVEIQRTGMANSSGLLPAYQKIVEALDLKKKLKKAPKYVPALQDIPRSHLSFYARLWEGTSGDRVITSNDPAYVGLAFAQVAPEWATQQKFQMEAADVIGVQALKQKVDSNRVRRGNETVPDFLRRVSQ